jgi:hypothetical protein
MSARPTPGRAGFVVRLPRLKSSTQLPVLINRHQNGAGDVGFTPNSGRAASPVRESAMCQEETWRNANPSEKDCALQFQQWAMLVALIELIQT